MYAVSIHLKIGSHGVSLVVMEVIPITSSIGSSESLNLLLGFEGAIFTPGFTRQLCNKEKCSATSLAQITEVV